MTFWQKYSVELKTGTNYNLEENVPKYERRTDAIHNKGNNLLKNIQTPVFQISHHDNQAWADNRVIQGGEESKERGEKSQETPFTSSDTPR